MFCVTATGQYPVARRNLDIDNLVAQQPFGLWRQTWS